jgi:hypothetical protein
LPGSSEIIAVLVGVIAAYVAGRVHERLDRRRRRTAVASALLYELRLMEANMRDIAKAARPSQMAVAAVPYPMHDALLAELVLFKPATVQAVLNAYGWFRDVRHNIDLVRNGTLDGGPERDAILQQRARHGAVSVPAAYHALIKEGGTEPKGAYLASDDGGFLPPSPFKYFPPT